MMTLCPSQDDEHAPYPHYLITTQKGRVFVICANCMHWIERFLKTCSCRNQCHAIAVVDRDLTVTNTRGRK